MATFQAQVEHAPAVAAMLFEFNSEFDSPVPSIEASRDGSPPSWRETTFSCSWRGSPIGRPASRT